MEKKNLNQNDYAKRGDIVMCDLGSGSGSEQGGIRPCVVIQNDVGNRFSPTLIIAPITSKKGNGKLPTHVGLNTSGSEQLEKDSVVLCEQIRTIDKKRVGGVCGRVSKENMERINAALITSIDIFKIGEQEVKDQVLVIKTREKIILELVEILNSELIKNLIYKYKMELIKLERLCNKYRLSIENYYSQNNNIKEIIREKKVDRSTRIVVI